MIRNLTGVTHDDTIDIASTDQSKFARPGDDLVTDCHNVWIDNVVTDAGGKKVVKLVAGNRRKVHDIHVSNIKALGKGWAIEIEGDWATERPTIDDMYNLHFDNVEGRSNGLVVITSNCKDVSFRNLKAADDCECIMEQRSGTRAVNLTIEGVHVAGPRSSSAAALFRLAGDNNQNIVLKNLRATQPIDTLVKTTGSIAGLVIEGITVHRQDEEQ